MQAELAKQSYTGKAGGDMVTVVVDGSQKVLSCAVDPRLLADNDKELLEGLFVSAANSALQSARQASAEAIQKKLSEQLGIPDLGGIFGDLLPKG